jgi:DNA helicase-2/ATP-dependent DNA helicase PcrA
VLGEVTKQGFEDLHDQLRTRQRFAEDRLAYVAASRAKTKLYLSASYWRQPAQKQPAVPSRVFQAALECVHSQGGAASLVPQPESGTPNPLEDQLRERRWPVPDDETALRIRQLGVAVIDRRDRLGGRLNDGGRDWFSELDATAVNQLNAEEQAQLASLDRAAVRLVDEEQQRARGLVVSMSESMSASELMMLRRDPQAYAQRALRPMPRRFSLAAAMGTKFHAWVEEFYSLEPTLDLGATGASLADLSGYPDELKRAEIEFNRWCEQFRESPFATRAPLALEEPFSLVLGDQQLRGRIDAVFAGRDGVAYQIVDWKTGTKPPDDLQLALYRAAWSLSVDCPFDQVGACFYQVPTGTVLQPSWQPKSISELARVVQAAKPDAAGFE